MGTWRGSSRGQGEEVDAQLLTPWRVVLHPSMRVGGTSEVYLLLY